MRKMFPRLKSKLILAPMAGYSDLAFRILCRRFGAGMCFTEMVSADAVVRGGIGVKLSSEDKPIALQLFGNEPEILLEAGKKFEKKINVLDINMGCPSPDIMKNRCGAYLLKDEAGIKKIVSTLSEGMKIPISVKIRKCKNIVEIAKIVEKCGGSAITVHGRTVKQGYSGRSDSDVIKKVRRAVGITVIGNGDVTSAKDAEKMMKETGCDYVMIGRAALKNPCLFSGTERNCDSRKIFLDYLKLAEKHKTEVTTIKNHAILFTKGVFGGAKAREKINSCKSTEEMRKIFENI
jgi:nifR3 family TIM-barrel protein